MSSISHPSLSHSRLANLAVSAIAALFLALGCTEFPKPRANDGGADRAGTDGILPVDGKDAPADNPTGDFGSTDGPANDAPVTADGSTTEAPIMCAAGTHLCNGTCADDHAPASCGTSCTPCPVITGGTATCDGTKCGGTCPALQQLCLGACIPSGQACSGMCPAGTHNCQGVCANNNAVNSCGTSCMPCPTPGGGSATCDGTKCDFTCQTGKKCASVCGTCCADADCGPRGNQVATCDTAAHECKYACPANLPQLCGGTCIASGACCTDANCPAQGGKIGRCDTSTRTCSYSCASDMKPCGAGCIPMGGCCTDTECSGNFSCQNNSCSTTVCRGGFTLCAGQCIAPGACCQNSDCGLCKKCVSNACQNQIGEDVKNECTQSPASSCGDEGTCDGNGGCKKWSAGTTCQTQTCSGGRFTPVRQCNGSGTCTAATAQSCSGNLGCNGNDCRSTCTIDADCVSNQFYCSSGSCVMKKAGGQSCTANTANQCTSGNCVDGVCCNTASCPACRSCGAGGTCTVTTPYGGEDFSAPTTCTGNKRCDRSGVCKSYYSEPCSAHSDCFSGYCNPSQSVCGGCGTYINICCPADTGLPPCEETWLTCSGGNCICGGENLPCCQTPGVAPCNFGTCVGGRCVVQ